MIAIDENQVQVPRDYRSESFKGEEVIKSKHLDPLIIIISLLSNPNYIGHMLV